jgi:hypothetical protein
MIKVPGYVIAESRQSTDPVRIETLAISRYSKIVWVDY